MLEFLKAEKTNAEEIIEVYKTVSEKMKKDGIDYTADMYRNDEEVVSDIESGRLFFVRDNGKIIGAVIVDEKEPEESKGFDWKTNNSHMFIRKLCLVPEALKDGIGIFTMFGVENILNRSFTVFGKAVVYEKNENARKFFEKLGYTCSGEASKDGFNFKCYMKDIANYVHRCDD